MMNNRDEIIAEVTSSIAARLKVELEDPLKELLVGLKASREFLDAQLKDWIDDISKLKSTEDLLEPLSGLILKVDTGLEFIPIESKSVSKFIRYSSIPMDSNLAGEGNCISTTKPQFSHKDEASFEVEVQRHNKNSTFLDYQEGKLFIPGTNFLVDYQSKRVSTHEVNEFDALNLHVDDDIQQLEHLKFISVDNLNQFTSYLFKSFKKDTTRQYSQDCFDTSYDDDN
ncbi:uncharacterized protein LOC113349388 [Papaver somniferum]|uniref:uncharacterized protein LOC113349388 n=1 Tax=Papaver somniferum TaxID=3469 RepID=UPI000E703AAC|nr:uncharacterized protein LOC113349388 [Papaver somniferum]